MRGATPQGVEGAEPPNVIIDFFVSVKITYLVATKNLARFKLRDIEKKVKETRKQIKCK